jgi:hypothetical protein
MRRLLAAFTLCISLLFPVALPISAQQDKAAQQDPQTQTVYVTLTGKKYHRDGCWYLASSKIPIRLKEAKAKGYTSVMIASASWSRSARNSASFC